MVTSSIQLADKLAFLRRQRHEDEVTVLAHAVREGIDALYREALIEAYLLGQVSRDQIAQELGPETLTSVEVQRDALQRDVLWGASDI